MNYKQVMQRAVETKLVLAPEQRLAWKFGPVLGAGPSVYRSEGGEHIVDPEFGNLLVMRDGAVIIEGAPTVSAAQTAADIALALGIV